MAEIKWKKLVLSYSEDDNQKTMEILEIPTKNGIFYCSIEAFELLLWLRKVVLDEEDWEENPGLYGELIARRLEKLGLLTQNGSFYVIPENESMAGWKEIKG